MQGHRLADREFSRRLSHKDAPKIQPGDYGRVLRDGGWVWMCCTPNGLIGDLSQHDVVDEGDTITVSPSIASDGGKTILVPGDDEQAFEERGLVGAWHGYLKQGIWEEC